MMMLLLMFPVHQSWPPGFTFTVAEPRLAWEVTIARNDPLTATVPEGCSSNVPLKPVFVPVMFTSREPPAPAAFGSTKTVPASERLRSKMKFTLSEKRRRVAPEATETPAVPVSMPVFLTAKVPAETVVAPA